MVTGQSLVRQHLWFFCTVTKDIQLKQIDVSMKYIYIYMSVCDWTEALLVEDQRVSENVGVKVLKK